MQLVINGHAKEISELQTGASLSDLIEILGLKNDRVAVELNGEIVSRASWLSTPVHSGGKLEIVHFVGGGAAS